MRKKEPIDDCPNDLDRMLDEALAKYAAVEPRAGLEGRILANLQNAPTNPVRTWWQRSLAAAAAAIVIVVVALGWQSSHRSRPVIASHPAATIPGAAPFETKDAHPAAIHARRVRTPVHKRIASVGEVSVAVAENPRLDQFPSPQPLSEQEQLLMSYVSDSPDQAVLVARARTEALEKDREAEMRELAAESNELQPQ